MDLAALYDAWAPRLLAYMTTITRDRHRAEDALQNLFVKLATRRPEMRDAGPYLYRAARNEALNVSRGRLDRPLGDLEVLAPSPESDGSIDPKSLAAALDRLPPDQSEVVLLHALEGFTFREIAEILAIPPDTAASRYRYAIEKLQDLMRHD